MEKNSHNLHYVMRDGIEPVYLFMRDESFYAESAAYIVVENNYDGYYGPEDADYWYDRACKGGIVFW